MINKDIMKSILIAISFVLAFILTACTGVTDITISQFVETYPFNYVGLMSTSTNVDSVDVYYSIASGSANEMQHVKVKPPVIIGGHFTNITFDSIGTRVVQGLKKPYIEHRGRRAIIDYSENGSHYFKIVNNGRYPVEYFIVGNHPIKQYNISDYWAGAAPGSATAPMTQYTSQMPAVFYQGGPVKFLLFPDKKPTQDIYIMNIDGTYGSNANGKLMYYSYVSTDTIVFKGSYNGKNIVNTPWSVNQVMALFRAEYRQSSDTVLTISYSNSISNTQKMRISGEGYEKDYYSGYSINSLTPKYYGIIPSRGEIRSSEAIPFITHVNY
jgi:hypothetical protein